jgi:hypothetical protein
MLYVPPLTGASEAPLYVNTGEPSKIGPRITVPVAGCAVASYVKVPPVTLTVGVALWIVNVLDSVAAS